MQKLEILRELNLGNSVAEFDEALNEYFVDTEPFRALVESRADIIAGDKGTGKTAIFRTLKNRYRQIDAMRGVEVLAAFNVSGNPIFQRLAQERFPITEQQYVSVWKAYVFSFVGNWYLSIVDAGFSKNRDALEQMLVDSDLRSQDDQPATIFSRLLNGVKKLFTPKSIELGMTLSESGIPIVTPKVEFQGDGEEASGRPASVPFEDALRLLNACLNEIDITSWVVLDRLDEAFQGFPEVEIPALRALLRVYLDLLEFDRVRMKLFLRRDLFRKIIKGGFVNLTHINARKKEILWEEADLMSLLCERTRKSGAVLQKMGMRPSASDAEIFGALFPSQVDRGPRKATSWNWIMARIQDGNAVRPPRNLLDLVMKAREAEIRKEERERLDFAKDQPLIQAESIKSALTRLSESRVEDTLLAEAGDAAQVIELFRGGKSEHNDTTLSHLLGVPLEAVQTAVRPLLDAGFLEPVGENYKVPTLYRDGLKITQGKAF
jgi:hypothetical protein